MYERTSVEKKNVAKKYALFAREVEKKKCFFVLNVGGVTSGVVVTRKHKQKVKRRAFNLFSVKSNITNKTYKIRNKIYRLFE